MAVLSVVLLAASVAVLVMGIILWFRVPRPIAALQLFGAVWFVLTGALFINEGITVAGWVLIACGVALVFLSERTSV